MSLVLLPYECHGPNLILCSYLRKALPLKVRRIIYGIDPSHVANPCRTDTGFQDGLKHDTRQHPPNSSQREEGAVHSEDLEK